MDTVTQELREFQRNRKKPVPIPPFVLDESLYPIEQENSLIEYFRTHYTEDVKKLTKLIYRTYPNTPKFMQKSLMNQLVEAKDPRQALHEYFAEKDRWMAIIEQMIAEGNHGVIYDNTNVHGINLNTQQRWLKEGDKWTIEDERDIIKKSYYGWARKNGITHFKGKVLMFHQFGFSGMSYFFDHEIDDAEGY